MNTLFHKQKIQKNIKVAIISVSTTRSLEQDKSGTWIKKQVKKQGHEAVVHNVVSDDIEAISSMVIDVVEKISPNFILMSGGTGLSPNDVTIEAVSSLFEKHLSAFGPLFAQ